jgi:hypothetical protein
MFAAGGRPVAATVTGTDVMNRVVAAAAGAVALAGCAGMSDLVPSMPGGGPVTTPIRIESEPSGADARTSLGQSCRTPCALNITAAGDFTVTYSLAGHLPQTVTVTVARASDLRPDPEVPTASTPLIEPNPVFAQLERAPPPVPAKKQPTKKKASPPPPAAPTAPAQK